MKQDGECSVLPLVHLTTMAAPGSAPTQRRRLSVDRVAPGGQGVEPSSAPSNGGGLPCPGSAPTPRRRLSTPMSTIHQETAANPGIAPSPPNSAPTPRRRLSLGSIASVSQEEPATLPGQAQQQSTRHILTGVKMQRPALSQK